MTEGAAIIQLLVGDRARNLTVNDMSSEATSIRGLDEDDVAVPEVMQPLLRSHLAFRQTEGADPTDPLLRLRTHARDYADRFHRPDRWRELMQRVEADTGLTGLIPRKPTTRMENRWNRESGFSLQRLSTA